MSLNVIELQKVKLLLVTIIEYISSDSYPDWVRCRFEDVHGKEWPIKEKVPVVTSHGFDESTPLPHPAYVAVRILKRYLDAQGRDVVTVDTDAIWGIETEDGASVFDVFGSQVVESELE
jgi:hypothetical protein